MTPFEGSAAATPAKEILRQQANKWMRTSGAFDGVIDFDAAVRDPANPARLIPDLDSGDHLHPGPAGAEKMAQAIDLHLFRKWGRRRCDRRMMTRPSLGEAPARA